MNRRLNKYLWRVYLLSFGGIFLLFSAISLGWLGFMPSLVELENPKSMLASEIYSADQKLLGTYYVENRSNANYDELPAHLVNALIATEDVRFMEHSGIDFKGLMRAVVFMGGRGGASTITQQLAKNLFPRERNQSKVALIITKFKEWVTAAKLEKRYTKEEIVAMYFNKFDFLNLAVGIKSASRVYFGTTPDQLNIQQSAMLVGMAQNPSLYNPIRRPEITQHRRNVVLGQMLKYDFITRAEFDSIKQLPLDLDFHRVDQSEGLATYFREFIRGYMHEWCRKHKKPGGEQYNLYKDGLRIYTTINAKMQAYAEQAVQEHLSNDLQPHFFKHWEGKKNAPFWRVSEKEIQHIMTQAMKRTPRYRLLKEAGADDEEIRQAFNTPVQMKVFSWHGEIDTVLSPMDSIRYHKYFLQSGLVSIEPQTGYVRAYVGGINHKYFKYDHAAQSRRQVGSTFKPFIYSLAMQEGESPCQLYPNIPTTIDMPVGQPDWTPRNSDDAKEGEMVSLKWALAHSVNYISAALIKKYKPQAVIRMARNMGITSPIDTVPSICLGTPDISVCEMVGAFSTFANKGVFVKPMFITRIEDKNGNILESFVPETREAMSEETAYLMTSLMKGVVECEGRGNCGTGVRLRFKYHLQTPIAGKTGTTQNQSDGWFIGLTRELVTGAWVGCEDRSAHFRSITYGQGANTGLPIWGLYMQRVYADSTLGISTSDFEKPDKLNVEVNCDVFNKGGARANPYVEDPF